MGDILMSEMKDLKIRRKRILKGTGCRVSYKIGQKNCPRDRESKYTLCFFSQDSHRSGFTQLIGNIRTIMKLITKYTTPPSLGVLSRVT